MTHNNIHANVAMVESYDQKIKTSRGEKGGRMGCGLKNEMKRCACYDVIASNRSVELVHVLERLRLIRSMLCDLKQKFEKKIKSVALYTA